MTARRRHLLRSLLAVGVVMIAVLAAASGASAAQITLIDGSGNQRSAEFSSLAGFQEAGFTLVNASGQKSTVTVKGITITQLFEQLGDPYFPGVSIPRPDGGTIEISRAQINSVSTQPMIIESEGGGIGFVRPQYADGDNNASDYFAGAGALTLKQLAGSAFDIKAEIEASTPKIKVGQSVTFEGSATGGGVAQNFTYSWNFGDGRSGKGQSIKHTFAKRGTYEVLLTAKAGGRTGTKVVTIQVGTPTKSTKKRSGGGDNDNAAAPASGVADGNSGDGLTAGSGEQQQERESKKKRKHRTERAAAGLPEVTGELLSAETTPLQPESSLAARSGTIIPPKQGAKIDGTTVAILGTLLLLGFGFASEFGQPGRFRRRIRGLS